MPAENKDMCTPSRWYWLGLRFTCRINRSVAMLIADFQVTGEWLHSPMRVDWDIIATERQHVPSRQAGPPALLRPGLGSSMAEALHVGSEARIPVVYRSERGNPTWEPRRSLKIHQRRQWGETESAVSGGRPPMTKKKGLPNLSGTG